MLARIQKDCQYLSMARKMAKIEKATISRESGKIDASIIDELFIFKIDIVFLTPIRVVMILGRKSPIYHGVDEDLSHSVQHKPYSSTNSRPWSDSLPLHMRHTLLLHIQNCVTSKLFWQNCIHWNEEPALKSSSKYDLAKAGLDLLKLLKNFSRNNAERIETFITNHNGLKRFLAHEISVVLLKSIYYGCLDHFWCIL